MKLTDRQFDSVIDAILLIVLMLNVTYAFTHTYLSVAFK